jgi:hypothetical protein
VRACIRGTKKKLIRTGSHVIDAQAVQWYASFRDVECRGSDHGLQKVHMRGEYLLQHLSNPRLLIDE